MDDHQMEYPEPYMGGVNTKEAANNLHEAMKMSTTEELRILFQAETKRMKDEHVAMMKKAKRQIMWLSLLVACAIAYEIWAIPALEQWMGIK